MGLPNKGRNKVTSTFGEVRTINGKTTTHDGIDTVGLDDKTVHSTITGVVDGVGWGADAGNYIRVRIDNKTMAYYFHLASYAVRAGQKIKPGDVLGVEGWTGNVIPRNVHGTHLHSEVRINGKKVVPTPWMGGIIKNKKGIYEDNSPAKGENDMKIGLYSKTDEVVRSSALKDGAIALAQPDGSMALYRRRMAREVDDNTLSKTFEEYRYKEACSDDIIAVTEN